METQTLEKACAVRFTEGRRFAEVTAWGDLDLANVPELRETLDTATGADEAILVDLSEVTYIDSSGFGALLDASRVTRPMGVTIYLAGCSTTIARMLEITRLANIFRIVPTMDDARQEAADGEEMFTAPVSQS